MPILPATEFRWVQPAPGAAWKHHPECFVPQVRTVACMRRCRSDAGGLAEASPAMLVWHCALLGDAAAGVVAFANAVAAPCPSAPASGDQRCPCDSALAGAAAVASC